MFKPWFQLEMYQTNNFNDRNIFPRFQPNLRKEDMKNARKNQRKSLSILEKKKGVTKAFITQKSDYISVSGCS